MSAGSLDSLLNWPHEAKPKERTPSRVSRVEGDNPPSLDRHIGLTTHEADPEIAF